MQTQVIAVEQLRLLSDADLVAVAIDSRQEAEGVEATVSPSRWREADVYVEMIRRDWTQQQIAEECKVTQSHVSYFVKCARNYRLVDNRPSFWKAFEEAKKGPVQENNSGENEWYTPKEYIDAARLVLGEIDLDPASTAIANEVVDAAEYYSLAEGRNGLDLPWKGRVWLNPPYAAGLVDQFADRLAEYYNTGAVTAAVVLVNNATETDWFATIISGAAAVCFPDQRVQFWAPDKTTTSPLQGQAVLYLGEKINEFIAAYREFGWIGLVAK